VREFCGGGEAGLQEVVEVGWVGEEVGCWEGEEGIVFCVGGWGGGGGWERGCGHFGVVRVVFEVGGGNGIGDRWW